MLRFSRFIVTHKKMLIILFALLLIPSIIGALNTKNNFDMLSYMPEELNSKQGEKILEEKFELSGTGMVVLNNKETWEIEEIKTSIKSITGVDNIISLSDLTDIYVPTEFIDKRIRDNFVKGESTLLQINFVENARTKTTGDAVKAIRKIIGEDGLFGGEPAIMEDLQATTDNEKVYYMVIAVISLFVILSLSMTSFLEPLLFLVAVGVAIVINMGTNVFLREISFITSSVVAVMQLGISMDYSIFLLHRFEEEKLKCGTIEEAMINAMNKTSIAISSSALTTLAGFGALMIMKNGIGADLGFVIGKGVLTSLIVNLTLLPCLILIFHKYSDKHRHKPILPSFKKISSVIVKGRWAFLILILVIATPAFLAQKKIEFYYTSEHYLPETTRSAVDTKAISEEFGATEVLYVITKNEGRVKEKALIENVKNIAVVEKVLAISEQVDMTIAESFIPKEVFKNFRGGDYQYFSVFLTTSADDKRTFAALDTIQNYTSGMYDEYYITGRAPLAKDLADLVDLDNRNVSILSISLILLILAISFMSLSIPLILILVIQLAIWINLGIPYFQGTKLASITPVIIGAIQLGATVDYAILFASRYKENLGIIGVRKEAIRQTIEDTGRSILTSALTMFSATIGIYYITSIKATGELTLLIGRGAIISMITIFLGLPSMFIIFDKLIGISSIKWPKHKK